MKIEEYAELHGIGQAELARRFRMHKTALCKMKKQKTADYEVIEHDGLVQLVRIARVVKQYRSADYE